MSEELKEAPARIAELEGALSWHEEQRNDMAELRAELEHRNKLISDMQAAWDMALHTIGRQNAELSALKAQEPVAWVGVIEDCASLFVTEPQLWKAIPLCAAPVSEAKAQGVEHVQWQVRYLKAETVSDGWWQDSSEQRAAWCAEANQQQHAKGLPATWEIRRFTIAAPAAPAADATVRQATDGGRNQSYEGLFDGETEEQRASRLAAHRSKGVV